MISNLVPGFRSIRTPLATGYLYLVLLWLWVGGLIPPSQTADGLIARAYQRGGMLGPTTVLAAASVTAYVLGGILSIDPVVSRTNPTRAISRCLRIKWWCDIRHIYGTTEQQLTALTRQRTDAALEAGLSAEHYSKLVFQADASDAADSHEPIAAYGKWVIHRCLGRPRCKKRTATDGSKKTAAWIEIEDSTFGMLFAEIPVLAVRLHAENKDLFDDYDRALAEAAFRISIMPPIVLIAFSIPFQPEPAVSAFWAVVSVIAGFVAFYALWTRAATKVRNANDISVQALVLDIVPSQLLGRLDSFALGTAQGTHTDSTNSDHVCPPLPSVIARRNQDPSPARSRRLVDED